MAAKVHNTEDNLSAHTDIDLKKLEELAKDSAVGDTMYEKKWVIENILEVGRHFQATRYTVNGEVRELEQRIEELMCTLWDISVEEDVSKFYLDHGVLDIFVELFSNPNVRVKEIAVGVMTNMVFHLAVFRRVVDKQHYLAKCLKLLEEKDSPTLAIVLRCLHSYGFNLFSMLTGDGGDEGGKEEAKHVVSTWLIFLGAEEVVQNLAVIIASCTNREVLLNGSKLLSIVASLWEHSEERRKMSQIYAEEQFLTCLLEGIKESLGEDKTEKHFLVFLNIVYEHDADKEVVRELSGKVVELVNCLFRDHLLEYGKVEDSDLEFVFNLAFVLQASLGSGGYETIPSSLESRLKQVLRRVERSDTETSGNKSAIVSVLNSSLSIVRSIEHREQNGNEDSEEDSSHSASNDSPSSGMADNNTLTIGGS